jgi:D-alanyl-D-alanine dipeptidase
MRLKLLLYVWILLLAACQSAPETGQEAAKVAAETLSSVPEQTVQKPLPPPPPDYDTTKWTEVARLDSSIFIDMKYATAENFVEEKMYDCSRCFLRPEVAKAVVRVHEQLQERDLGLKMLDCFRPRPIQWKLWEKVPDPRYVADPRKGSMHNRGAAVDLTLVNAQGEALEMGTPYDFFGPEAHPSYTNLPDSVLANRATLRDAMLSEGFQPITTEWWHFSLGGKNYALSDMLWKCY